MILDDERLRAALCAADAAMLAALPQESTLSHSFSPRFLRRMRPLLRRQRQPVVQVIFAAAKQVAVLALVSVTVMLTTLMSVEATRARAVEIAVQVLERYTSITVQWDPARSNEAFVPVLPTYIPQDMELYEEENERGYIKRRYTDATGEILWYTQQHHNGGNTMVLDTEDTTVYSKMIAGQEVAYYMNKGYNQMYWYDDKNMYILFTSLDERTMFAIAKSVILQEK